MAFHGYIVMSVDHTGNSRFTFLDGKVVRSGGERASNSATDRPGDISFLLDTMTRMNAGADSRFAARVNLDQVAVSGMSFGGSTSINVLSLDSRIKAGVMLAPGGPVRERQNPSTPIMMIIGTEDSTSVNQYNPEYGNGFGSGVRITNGEPLTYLDAELSHTIINAYALSFLNTHVRGMNTYSAFLRENHYGDKIVYKR